MKSYALTLLAVATVGGLSLPKTASAQAMWSTSRSLTVAITLSYTGQALQLKDENGKVLKLTDGGGPTFENTYSVMTTNANGDVIKTVNTYEHAGKAVVVKRGNAEILRELLDAGMLILNSGDPATSISGWSLVVVSDPEWSMDTIYARHTSRALVPVDGLTFGLNIDTPADSSTFSYKEVATEYTPVDKDPTSTFNSTYTGTFRYLGSAMVPGIDGGLTGIYSSSASKVTVKTEGTGEDKIYTPVTVPPATKLDKILGAAMIAGEINFAAIVEGSISATGGTIVDMNTWGPPM